MLISAACRDAAPILESDVLRILPASGRRLWAPGFSGCSQRPRGAIHWTSSPFCFPKLDLSCFILASHANRDASLRTHRTQAKRRSDAGARRPGQYFTHLFDALSDLTHNGE